MYEIRLLISTHVFYKDLYLYPPEGVIWRGTYRTEDFENLALYSPHNQLLRKVINHIYTILDSPRYTFVINTLDCDLIYSGRAVLILNKKPWITDFEHVSHFVGLDRNRILKESIKHKIRKSLNSNYCKKILPHTYAAKQTFENVFGNEFKKKTEVLYQTMKPTQLKRRKDDDMIILLFNGNYIHKGGDFVLQTFEKLNERYKNLKLIFISNPDNNVKERYRKRFSNIHFIQKGSHISREQLINEYYMKSDIFVYPSQGDTYANPLLLAMNSALPIICTDYYAFPEFVTDNDNGLLVHSSLWDYEKLYPKINLSYDEGLKIIREGSTSYVNELIQKLSILIEDRIKRQKMGDNSRELITNGKFSMTKRNQQLLKLFQNSIQ